MKVVSWNCRGLGSNKKIEAMKDLIRMSNPEILLIQETKLEQSGFLYVSQFFWKRGEGATMSARGASGGLGTLWNSIKFDLVHSSSCTHWIPTRLRHKESRHLVSILNLYVPVLFQKRRKKKIIGIVSRKP